MNRTRRVIEEADLHNFTYRGWNCSWWRDEKRGQNHWSARRWGVGLNTNTRTGLLNMIDHKEDSKDPYWSR